MTELKLASRKSRVFAFIIDHFIISFIVVVPFTFFLINEGLNNNLVFRGFWIGLFVAFVLYSFKDSYKGASIGKSIIGIGVRDEENKDEVPSKTRLFLRNLILIIWPVELIVFAVNKDKQRIGDNLANSVVVQVRKLSLWKTIVVVFFIVILTFMLFISSIVLFMKNSEAYNTAITYIENDEYIIRETGGIEGYGYLPTGNIQIADGFGESKFAINIKGEDHDLYVEIYLTKKPQQDWVVEDMYY
ncbi:RDD family protein [Aquisalibacillus elongatus]|uniref:Putative RDD family membrane protein YckC n=1 Tax=Aquisalibacillus elongatus TaxID=485577 RepID=A0A3N5BL06_9BACI|nr:RDD family protein [Aquisalibacillus elongatus]RPF50368.1 putative RDD family membrane protein YckC [Aquisalibacillus elongatus]